MHTAQDEMRLNHGDVAELKAAQCLACINCGNRVYPQIKPALPMRPEMIPPKQDLKGSAPGRKPSHTELMEKYYDSIKLMRKGKHPTGWDAIARLIVTAEGVKITGDTVAKYFAEMIDRKGKRGPKP
jgi:hypothetical protein